MSFLSELSTYWQANTTLQTALNFNNSVWVGVAPEGTAFPFAVITEISNVPTYTTCSDGYIADLTFQVSVYGTGAAAVEALTNTITAQLDHAAIASATMLCYRTNGPILLIDETTPQIVYHGFIEFDCMSNRTIASN